MCHGQTLVFLIFLACAITIYAKTGYGPGDQDWGYVKVRKDAHMFYWLYKSTAKLSNYTERPLVIWLQGGPGDSSTGYGNFEELGPIDMNGNYRNSTWVKDMNVLFIDNPVGAGYSYVGKRSILSSNNAQIALDLIQLMKGFYAKHPEFEDVPLHIFCESYGGKMAPEFALKLYNAIQSKQIKSNLISVVLGDPWTSPIDSVLNWAPLLLNMGIVDQPGYTNIMAAANETLDLIKAGNWTDAAFQMFSTLNLFETEAKGVDYYNIEKPTTYNRIHPHSTEYADHKLETLMRGPVSKALGIPYNVKWGSQSDDTYAHLMGDLMKPVTHIVSELLDKTTVKVAVLSGQLDLICATAGTVNWIDKMVWKDRNEYIRAPRQAIGVNGILEGYKKSSGNFTMFWVNRAGHMVVTDNQAAMAYILKDITGYGL